MREAGSQKVNRFLENAVVVCLSKLQEAFRYRKAVRSKMNRAPRFCAAGDVKSSISASFEPQNLKFLR
jgi:hypothetical protein